MKTFPIARACNPCLAQETWVENPCHSQMSNRRMEMKVASDPANLAAVRKAIEGFASACGFDEKRVGEVGLCVNETVANIIRHAYEGKTDRPVDIAAEAQDGELVVTIRDWGIGVDPS